METQHLWASTASHMYSEVNPLEEVHKKQILERNDHGSKGQPEMGMQSYSAQSMIQGLNKVHKSWQGKQLSSELHQTDREELPQIRQQNQDNFDYYTTSATGEKQNNFGI